VRAAWGEVYRATDTTLGREVALKLLPGAFASDPERLARFEREAKVLASLNHSSIAHVYGFERATLEDGSSAHFLAMELVEGEDLAARLTRGAFPIDESIAIAKQIAEGLEEAHEHGIVHRDLKPANIKLTPDGKVKVLDFGLAKAYAADAAGGSSPDLSQSPTLAHAGTAAGLILGTAAYMSPEQARGKPVDKRADIWAFGVLLYEMLTGKPLFTGDILGDGVRSRAGARAAPPHRAARSGEPARSLAGRAPARLLERRVGQPGRLPDAHRRRPSDQHHRELVRRRRAGGLLAGWREAGVPVVPRRRRSLPDGRDRRVGPPPHRRRLRSGLVAGRKAHRLLGEYQRTA